MIKNNNKKVVSVIVFSFFMAAPAYAGQSKYDDKISQLIAIINKQSQQIQSLEKRMGQIESRKVYVKKVTYNKKQNEDASVVRRINYSGTPEESIRFHDPYAERVESNNYFEKLFGYSARDNKSTTQVNGLILKWGNGIPAITTENGDYSFRLRGRILADYGSSFGSRFHNLNVSRTMMRAARIGAEGRIKQLSWVIESDFSSNSLVLMSAYATWTTKTFGHVAEYTLGHKFSERGFDGSTGSYNTVFLDRDLVATTLVPVMGWYGLGGAYKIYGNNWHVATQIAGDQVNNVNMKNNIRDDITYLARAHYIPFRNNTYLLHLGIWGYYEDVKPAQNFTQDIEALSRTNNNFNLQFGPTAPLAHSFAGGLELFGMRKSMWALVEFGARRMTLRRTSGIASSSTDFAGMTGTVRAFSAQYGVFLTGEKPNYMPRNGVWGLPHVLHPVIDGGMGAWELAFRWDWANSSHVFSGADAWTLTAGLNWYLMSTAHLMFNYTHAHVYNATGDYIGSNSGDTFGARVAVIF